jgi:NADH dehydrogenase
VVRALARAGHRVRVAVRQPARAYDLLLLGDVGQIQVVQANIRDKDSVARALDGAQACVNLVGVLYESGRQKFASLHAEGAGNVAQAAQAAGVTRMVQVSAIGADAGSSSIYARTKAAGEAAVRAAMPQAVILRPSIVFGPEDDFFNRFAAMAVLSPALPLIGGGKTKFQPVFVGDVAEAIARSVDGMAKGGLTYELGGPNVLSFRECMEEMLQVIDRRRLLVPVPWWAAEIQGTVLGLLPNPPLTRDQVTLLRSDNVVSEEAKRETRTLDGLGIEPQSTAAILPGYLWRYRAAGQFTRRSEA